jgi:hypothetical protein
MRTTVQPHPEAPLSAEAKIESYLGALKECHVALMDTSAILGDIADMVIAFVNGDESIDPDVLKEVCVKAQTLVKDTTEQFGIEGVDKTPSESV